MKTDFNDLDASLKNLTQDENQSIPVTKELAIQMTRKQTDEQISSIVEDLRSSYDADVNDMPSTSTGIYHQSTLATDLSVNELTALDGILSIGNDRFDATQLHKDNETRVEALDAALKSLDDLPVDKLDFQLMQYVGTLETIDAENESKAQLNLKEYRPKLSVSAPPQPAHPNNIVSVDARGRERGNSFGNIGMNNFKKPESTFGAIVPQKQRFWWQKDSHHSSAHDPNQSINSNASSASVLPSPANTITENVVMVGPYKLIPIMPIDAATYASKELICVSDVFQTFFHRRHFDEFRQIIKKYAKPSFVVPIGETDSVEVLSKDELINILHKPEARKEGIAVVKQLGRATADANAMNDELNMAKTSADTIQFQVMKQERKPVQLTSGIRTRGSDNSDIGYVHLNAPFNRTLPAWVVTPFTRMGIPEETIDGQYVRVADLAKLFVLPNRHKSKTKLINRLLSAIDELQYNILQLPVAVKNRLVVHAQSSHHASLDAILDLQIPAVLKVLKRGKSYSIKADHSDMPASKKRRHISGNSDRSSSLANSDSGRSEQTTDESELDAWVASITPKENIDVAPGQVPPLRLHRGHVTSTQQSDAQLMMTLPAVQVQRIVNPYILKLANVNTSPLATATQPCVVELNNSIPILVIWLREKTSERGPIGKLYEHLLLVRHAQCIICTVCDKYFSVMDYVLHDHSSDEQLTRIIHSSHLLRLSRSLQPRLYRYTPSLKVNSNSKRVNYEKQRQDVVWVRVQARLQALNLAHFMHQLPDVMMFKAWQAKRSAQEQKQLRTRMQLHRLTQLNDKLLQDADDRFGDLYPVITKSFATQDQAIELFETSNITQQPLIYPNIDIINSNIVHHHKKKRKSSVIVIESDARRAVTAYVDSDIPY